LAHDSGLEEEMSMNIRELGKDVGVSTLQLRELGPKDEPAFLRWIESWKNESPEWATFTWIPGMSHSEHLQKLHDQKDSTKIPANRVPSTMLYAFVDGDIVGRFSIRHQLNDNLKKRGGHVGYSVARERRQRGYAKEMFKQGISYCQTLGLNKILVTCSDDNEPSWRVIEAFGGALENRIFDEEEDELIRRYWVDVEQALYLASYLKTE
jgi:predicted acetyltransferase